MIQTMKNIDFDFNENLNFLFKLLLWNYENISPKFHNKLNHDIKKD